MSYILTVDRTADGAWVQLFCEKCGTPGDWVTIAEATAMAIKGYMPILCMNCDMEESNCVPDALLIDDDWMFPDYYILDFEYHTVTVNSTSRGHRCLSSYTYLNTAVENE